MFMVGRMGASVEVMRPALVQERVHSSMACLVLKVVFTWKLPMLVVLPRSST